MVRISSQGFKPMQKLVCVKKRKIYGIQSNHCDCITKPELLKVTFRWLDRSVGFGADGAYLRLSNFCLYRFGGNR